MGQSCADISQQVHSISGHHPESIILPSHTQHTITHPTSPNSDDMQNGSAAATASAHVFLMFPDIAVAAAVLAALHQHALVAAPAAGLPREDEGLDLATVEASSDSAAAAAAAAATTALGHDTSCSNAAAGSSKQDVHDSKTANDSSCLPAFQASISGSGSAALVNGSAPTRAELYRPLIAKFAALKVDKVCCVGCDSHECDTQSVTRRC